MNLQQLFAVPMPPPREEPEQDHDPLVPASSLREYQRGRATKEATRARLRAAHARRLAEAMLQRPEGHVTRQEAAQMVGCCPRRFNHLAKRHGIAKASSSDHVAWYSLEELRKAGILGR